MSKFSDSEMWKKYAKDLKTKTVTYGKNQYPDTDFYHSETNGSCQNGKNHYSNTDFNHSETNTVKSSSCQNEEQPYTLRLKYFNTKYVDSPNVYTYYELETNDLNVKSPEHIFCAIDKDMLNYDKKTNTLSIGEINACNELNQLLLELIMTPDDILQTKCGNVNATGYRAQLVKQLNELWD